VVLSMVMRRGGGLGFAWMCAAMRVEGGVPSAGGRPRKDAGWVDVDVDEKGQRPPKGAPATGHQGCAQLVVRPWRGISCGGSTTEGLLNQGGAPWRGARRVHPAGGPRAAGSLPGHQLPRGDCALCWRVPACRRAAAGPVREHPLDNRRVGGKTGDVSELTCEA
jgi:hypothetical protein